MSPETRYSEIQRSDVNEIADLHRVAFPSFFLSTLGTPFLRQFYEGFVDDPDAVSVVAKRDNEILGVVVGTTRPTGFFRRLLKRRLLGFARASLVAVLKRPSIAPRLLVAIAYRGDSPTGIEGALLSSICVAPGSQGSGTGKELIRKWISAVRGRGALRAFLTTDADGNDRVNDFYLSNGWELYDLYTTGKGRRMNRFVHEFPSTKAG